MTLLPFWPFQPRVQRPRPQWVRARLAKIPREFLDDGCSRSPDMILGYDLRHACRLHDFAGCTRCHAPGSLTLEAMRIANRELEDVIDSALPDASWLTQRIYGLFVRRFNGDVAWDSCGTEAGDLCRHNMPRPEWMQS